MKFFILTGIISLFIFSCNNDSGSQPKSTAITEDTVYQKGVALVAEYKCFQCHKIDEKLTGPSYMDVAKRYEGASEEKINELANKVIKGSSGNWGEIFMTPHPNLSEEDAKSLVRYILLLNK